MPSDMVCTTSLTIDRLLHTNRAINVGEVRLRGRTNWSFSATIFRAPVFDCCFNLIEQWAELIGKYEIASNGARDNNCKHRQHHAAVADSCPIDVDSAFFDV